MGLVRVKSNSTYCYIPLTLCLNFIELIIPVIAIVTAVATVFTTTRTSKRLNNLILLFSNYYFFLLIVQIISLPNSENDIPRRNHPELDQKTETEIALVCMS